MVLFYTLTNESVFRENMLDTRFPSQQWKSPEFLKDWCMGDWLVHNSDVRRVSVVAV